MAFMINFASAAEMERKLPGIGQKKAEVLVQLREEKGKIDTALFEAVLGKAPGDELLSLIDFGILDESSGAFAAMPPTLIAGTKEEKDDAQGIPRSKIPPRPLGRFSLDHITWPKVSSGGLWPIRSGLGSSQSHKLPETRQQSRSPSPESDEARSSRKKLARRHRSSPKKREENLSRRLSPSSESDEARSSRKKLARRHRTLPKKREENPSRRFLTSQVQKQKVKETDKKTVSRRHDRSTSHSRKDICSWSPSKSREYKRKNDRREGRKNERRYCRVRSRSSSSSGSSSSRSPERQHKGLHRNRYRSSRSSSRSGSNGHKSFRRYSKRTPSRRHSRRRSLSRARHGLRDGSLGESTSRHARRREYRSSSSSSRERYYHSRHSGHAKVRSVFYFNSSEDTSSEDERYSSRRRGVPTKIPKNLRFDGNSNWLSFKQKFESYRTVLHWSEGECRDYLGWCLEGKALDFFTMTMQMGRNHSFRAIMKKLEMRFGAKELPETSRAKFHQAFQYPEESLNDWADRVLTMATPAFRGLPDKHCRLEAISKFCQGCLDKEAGKHACLEHPRSMEEAIDKVKHFQYITQAVDGKRKSRDDSIMVNAVGSLTEADVKRMIENALSSVTSKLGNTSIDDNVNKSTSSGFPCYFCKQVGHFKRDCDRYKSWLQKREGKGQNDRKAQELRKRPRSFGQTLEPREVNDHSAVSMGGTYCLEQRIAVTSQNSKMTDGLPSMLQGTSCLATLKAPEDGLRTVNGHSAVSMGGTSCPEHQTVAVHQESSMLQGTSCLTALKAAEDVSLQVQETSCKTDTCDYMTSCHDSSTYVNGSSDDIIDKTSCSYSDVLTDNVKVHRVCAGSSSVQMTVAGTPITANIDSKLNQYTELLALKEILEQRHDELTKLLEKSGHDIRESRTLCTDLDGKVHNLESKSAELARTLEEKDAACETTVQERLATMVEMTTSMSARIEEETNKSAAASARVLALEMTLKDTEERETQLQDKYQMLEVNVQEKSKISEMNSESLKKLQEKFGKFAAEAKRRTKELRQNAEDSAKEKSFEETLLCKNAELESVREQIVKQEAALAEKDQMNVVYMDARDREISMIREQLKDLQQQIEANKSPFSDILEAKEAELNELRTSLEDVNNGKVEAEKRLTRDTDALKAQMTELTEGRAEQEHIMNTLLEEKHKKEEEIQILTSKLEETLRINEGNVNKFESEKQEIRNTLSDQLQGQLTEKDANYKLEISNVKLSYDQRLFVGLEEHGTALSDLVTSHPDHMSDTHLQHESALRELKNQNSELVIAIDESKHTIESLSAELACVKEDKEKAIHIHREELGKLDMESKVMLDNQRQEYSRTLEQDNISSDEEKQKSSELEMSVDNLQIKSMNVLLTSMTVADRISIRDRRDQDQGVWFTRMKGIC